MPKNNKHNNKNIQYIRLLAEVYAVILPDQIHELSVSMDLPEEEVLKLFKSADEDFTEIKNKL